MSGKSDLFGHPRGLTVLFATEMWERFSYYGMAALVVLYMTKYLFLPGRVETVLGYAAVKQGFELLLGPLEPQPLASLIYGCYTGLAYLTPIAGGFLADRVLGQRRTVVLGGTLMAIGHFLMTVEALFFPALTFLILGVGTFKPNISTQVGGLYAAGDPRHLRAYSVFYVGVNLGAFLAPLVCGTLGEAAGWHFGFAAAGIGMVLGLIIYVSGWRTLPADAPVGVRTAVPLDRAERRAMAGLLAVSGLTAFFWATYDQQGNTIVLWAEDFTQRSVDLGLWRGDIPTTWFLALNPLLIFMLTPLLLRAWTWQRALGLEPAPVAKMALGFAWVVLAYLVMALAALVAGNNKAGPLWLLGYFILLTIGELHVAPVGLALVSRVAPARMLAMTMGMWFAATFPGDLLGGFLGTFWSRMDKPAFFLMMAGVAGAAGIMMALLTAPAKRLFAE
jgi:POT family proton-dependent oligopeptide transporter